MRPHIRSSAEYRRRSVASETPSRQESFRRKGYAGLAPIHHSEEGSHSSNLSSLSSQHGLSEDNNAHSSSKMMTNDGNGHSSGIQRRESIAGTRSFAGHDAIRRRESAPIFGFYSKSRERDPISSERRRSSHLDCTMQDVNLYRIKILVVSFVAALSVIGVVWYFRFKSPFVE